MAELTARVAAHADDLHVGQEVGASSAAAWWAHTTHTTRAAAAGTVKLGHALEAHLTLCHWHHQRAHDPAYATTYHPDGEVTFRRRQ
ncbi:hypothetical protein [Nocardioides caricicola]|uniref:DUF222 domain-containing protein n=1 Tax=Nocardioides caricicola TaxID=634770 RepID=A0ABW0N377_9ACTN